jgi:DNA-directed RNA polymerase specialized sigma24 family protein
MEFTSEGSVTRWISDLKSGGDAAAQHLWERYFDHLVHLARNKLRALPRHGAVEDEEDAALSAFDSFCRRAAEGRFPRLTDRDDLWKLLVVITVRKVFDQIERQHAVTHGDRRVVGESDLPAADEDRCGAGLDGLAAAEPTPEVIAMVTELYGRLCAGLEDDDGSLRRVLDLQLEGYSREEIAERLGCAVRTVARKLLLIRETCLKLEAEVP